MRRTLARALRPRPRAPEPSAARPGVTCLGPDRAALDARARALPMSVERITPVLNVTNVPASIAWFERLGWRRAFSWNGAGPIAGAADQDEHGAAEFAGVCTERAEIFLCQDGQGSRGGPLPRHAEGDDTGGVWMSWWMGSPAEVDALHALAVRSGCEVTQPPTDEPWGVREFHLRHPDGHTFRVSAGLAEG